LIIEKESEAGGLSKTVTDENGFKWDLGVHVIGSSRFPAFLKMLTDTLPEWNQIKRCVKADITGIGGKDDRKTVYAPYPVQNSIHYFPTAIRDKCLSELEKITKLNEPTNFADFSEIHFGKTLQSEFIRPYNEKVWTVKLEEMNCRWVEGRVPKIDLTLLRKRCKSPLIIDENEQEEPIFRYPAKCNGIGELWQRLADSFSQKHFLYNTEVLRIDSREKKVSLNSNKI
jgi:protoporphyrinogen oxidase